MPPAQRKPANDQDGLRALLEQTREDIARLGQSIERLGPEQSVRSHDEDGWVVGGRIWVDENSIRTGDLVSFPPVPGYHPVVGRYNGTGFRYEYGGVIATEYAARPWRLLWRSPGEWADQEKKAEIEAPKGRRSRSKAAQEPEEDGDD